MLRLFALLLVFTTFLAASAIAAGLSFDEYPALYHFFDQPKAPNLSTVRAREYQTLLRREVASGPNFAGTYRLVPIGVGSATIFVAVINVETGKVAFPKSLALITWFDWPGDLYGPDFRLASRLLVVRGRVGTPDSKLGTYYFEWNGHDFVPRGFERVSRK